MGYLKTNNIPKRFADRELLISNNDVNLTKQGTEYYQWESGIVLDIILDDTHPLFKLNSAGGLGGNVIVPTEFPLNCKGLPAKNTDMSYSTIGCILVRLCGSQQNLEKEDVAFAYPLDNSCTTYPLLNELVQVVFYLDKYYYTNKINYKSLVNSSADFRLEPTYGKNSGNRPYGDPTGTVSGPLSKFDSLTKVSSYPGMRGVLGAYFWFNRMIRGLRRREGDTVIESRFGQSVRLGAYDDDRGNDVGIGDDYVGGGGNPFLLIRNKQRPIVRDNPPDNEKNADGYIIEDVNADGSSIHLTSGLTVSKFVTTCYKATFSEDVSEEQPNFSPSGATTYIAPILDGNQIVINSDRLIFSSRTNETLHYSKQRYAIVTDDEYTVDSQNQIVLTTNNKAVINAPAIYLGEYDNTNEPAVLGQTMADWLYDLCDWLESHVHWYKHSHPNTGDASPEITQLSTQLKDLQNLRNQLNTLLSRRVFITGGGYAPGSDGAIITDATVAPTKIDVSSGEGVPGGFKKFNSRKNNI